MVAAPADAMWSVAVFAHNEEAFVAACLDSLAPAADGRQLEVFVLINGCTDRTEAIVSGRARRDPTIHPVVIKLGDKANAWNVYVHEVAPERAMHFFVDGDVRVRPISFCHLYEALRTTPGAAAACGVPMSGRSRSTLTKHILYEAGFHGSLYALSSSTAGLLRAAGIRLPIGLIGDDSLLGWLLQRDLDPRCVAERSRIVPHAEAGFDFENLSPWRPNDWRRYYRRLRRNSLRQMQLNLLMPLLRERGLAALPAHIASIYTPERLAELQPRWPHATGYFDWLARRSMRSARRLRQN